jgi:acyl-[acyl-carrier-protein]-phospholipid O-acyltransferase/long-chain-fatty-acid--[acyl-carrier-protein] ligase
MKRTDDYSKYDISHCWFSGIKKNKKFFLADSTGVKIEARKILVGVLLMQDFLKAKMPYEEKNIAMIMPASVAGSLANIALLNLGKTICHLNYTSDAKSLNNSIEISNVNTLLTSKKFINKLKDKGFDISSSIGKLNIIYLEDLKSYATAVKKIKYYLLTFLQSSILRWLFAQKNQPDKTAFVLFSSGSESMPKGIRLSHRNIVGNVMQSNDRLNAKEDDVLIGILPIFHSFGLTVCTILPQLIGLSVVYHPDPTDGITIAELTSNYRGTILFATPTFLRLYTTNKKIHSHSFQTLNKVIAGAEKLPENIRAEFQKKFGLEVYEGYGATETSPVISCNAPNDKQQNKIGTVGKPLIGTQVLIVDPETYNKLDVNEEGLIMVAGVQVMQGYLGDKESAFKVIEGTKFYSTGDRGKIDQDGYITIIDRYSRFAKIAGEMISLSKLESEIYKHIGESIEICATYLEDNKKGEQLVVLHTEEIDIDGLKHKLINDINPLFIPKKFLQVDQIPKLGSGKVGFSEVREIAKLRLSI